jgi:hypothetical protein
MPVRALRFSKLNNFLVYHGCVMDLAGDLKTGINNLKLLSSFSKEILISKAL